MKLALIGHGKMGKAIEELALQHGHSIALTIDQRNLHEFTAANLAKTDVAIEFTGPHSAYDNVKKCLENGIPIVCGSTGWTSHLDELKKLCTEKKGSFAYSSNF